MNVNHQAVKEGATHWSPANNDSGRTEAYWRPDWKGGYNCWAVVAYADGNKWQKNNCELPAYAVALTTKFNGKGLPPVGTVCEAYHPVRGVWLNVKILDRQGDTKCLACRDDKDYLWWSTEFRPIRTPEQIAASKKRDLATDEWLDGIRRDYGDGVASECRNILADAGYGKP